MLNPSRVWRLFFLIATLLIGGGVGFFIWGRHEEPSKAPPSTISPSTSDSQQRTPSNTGPSPYSSQEKEPVPFSISQQKHLEIQKGKLKKELTDSSRACIINMREMSKKKGQEGAEDLKKWPDMATDCQPTGDGGLKKSTQKGKEVARRHCTEKLVPLYCETFSTKPGHQHVCMVQLKHECTKN